MLFDASDWTKYASGAESIAKVFGIVIGGGWVFWRFIYQGEFKKRIGFEVDVRFVSQKDDVWLVELLARVDNKGVVTHKINKFTFELRGLYDKDAIEESEKANGQIAMRILKEGSWLPKKWSNTFIRPGVCNVYAYVTAVPREATVVLLTGRFNYAGREGFHTALKLVDVPKVKGEAGS
jgi:hypothetical protein